VGGEVGATLGDGGRLGPSCWAAPTRPSTRTGRRVIRPAARLAKCPALALCRLLEGGLGPREPEPVEHQVAGQPRLRRAAGPARDGPDRDAREGRLGRLHASKLEGHVAEGAPLLVTAGPARRGAGRLGSRAAGLRGWRFGHRPEPGFAQELNGSWRARGGARSKRARPQSVRCRPVASNRSVALGPGLSTSERNLFSAAGRSRDPARARRRRLTRVILDLGDPGARTTRSRCCFRGLPRPSSSSSGWTAGLGATAIERKTGPRTPSRVARVFVGPGSLPVAGGATGRSYVRCAVAGTTSTARRASTGPTCRPRQGTAGRPSTRRFEFLARHRPRNDALRDRPVTNVAPALLRGGGPPTRGTGAARTRGLSGWAARSARANGDAGRRIQTFWAAPRGGRGAGPSKAASDITMVRGPT